MPSNFVTSFIQSKKIGTQERKQPGFVSSFINEKQREKVVTKSLSPFLGGGEYLSVPGKPEVLVTEERGYGTLESKTGNERDHIIPVSLGGTSSDPNLQYLASDKTFLQKI